MSFPLQATSQAPAPVAPPQLPGTPGGPVQGASAGTDVVITSGPGGAPVARVMSRREISALRDARTELSNQVQSATRRRDELVEQLAGTEGVNRAGLEERIKVLDARIVQIEGEIARTGEVLASSLAQSPVPNTPFRNTRVDYTAIGIVFTIFVMTPIAIAMARLLWKRATSPKPQPSFDRENSERLQRLEHAVDSIALEMERVSEGQRFVTRLLSESPERQRIEVPRG